MEVEAAAQNAHQRHEVRTSQRDVSSVRRRGAGLQVGALVCLARVDVLSGGQRLYAIGNDEQKEDDDEDNSERVDLLDVGRVAWRRHAKDNHEQDQASVRQAELRPICRHLNRRIAADGVEENRVQALGEHLEEEYDADVEVNDEAGHRDGPATRWEVLVHRI